MKIVSLIMLVCVCSFCAEVESFDDIFPKGTNKEMAIKTKALHDFIRASIFNENPERTEEYIEGTGTFKLFIPNRKTYADIILAQGDRVYSEVLSLVQSDNEEIQSLRKSIQHMNDMSFETSSRMHFYDCEQIVKRMTLKEDLSKQYHQRIITKLQER